MMDVHSAILIAIMINRNDYHSFIKNLRKRLTMCGNISSFVN